MTLTAPFHTKRFSGMGRAVKACLADANDPGADFVKQIRERPMSITGSLRHQSGA